MRHTIDGHMDVAMRVTISDGIRLSLQFLR